MRTPGGAGLHGQRGGAGTHFEVGQARLGQRHIIGEEGAILAGDQGWVENVYLWAEGGGVHQLLSCPDFLGQSLTLTTGVPGSATDHRGHGADRALGQPRAGRVLSQSWLPGPTWEGGSEGPGNRTQEGLCSLPLCALPHVYSLK